MKMYVGSQGLYAALKEQGFSLPENCRDVNLVADFDQPLILQYNVLLTPEDLQAVGRALESMGQQNAAAELGAVPSKPEPPKMRTLVEGGVPR